MSVDRKKPPKGYRKAWNGGKPPVRTPEDEEWARRLALDPFAPPPPGLNYNQGSQNMSDFPRRIQMEKLVPAEKLICDAMLAVESMGADLRLTDAVDLLGKARNRVADFVDGVSPAAPSGEKSVS